MDCAAPNYALMIFGGIGLVAAGIFLGLCIAAFAVTGGYTTLARGSLGGDNNGES